MQTAAGTGSGGGAARLTFRGSAMQDLPNPLHHMNLLRAAVPLLVLLGVGCDSSSMALGDVNSFIVVADDSLWSEVGDTVLTALQPKIFTVREEPMFELTHTTYGGEDWGNLRRFRQMLVVGQASDPWVQQALEEADTTVQPPAIVETDNVWARNQQVTALVLPESGAADAVVARLDSLRALFDRRYRAWAQTRMYYSGHDEALADTLRQEGGFSLDMPVVYRWRRTGDSAFMFLNDQPDASQLVRSVLVTWRSGTEGRPAVDPALAWRDSVAERFYDWGQTTERTRLDTARIAGPGQDVLEIRGVWSGTLEDFPQAGPFITRVVDCPAQNRRYLLDTWLYAPARDKYQYIIQLETLLNSFRCGEARQN